MRMTVAATAQRRIPVQLAGCAMALASALVPSCAESPTELWVVVQTNIAMPGSGTPPRIDQVRIETTIDGAATPFWNVAYDLRGGTYALPGHTVLRPATADEARAVRVRVRGGLDNGVEVRQEALVSFSRGRRVVVRMFLALECAGERQKMCEEMGKTCGEDGQCIDVGRPVLPDYGDGDAASCNASGVTVTQGIAAPRLLWPPGGSTATTRNPTVRWELPANVTGGRVEFCRDRGCQEVIGAFEAQADRVRPGGCRLPAGVVFFRVRGRRGGAYGAETSRVWQVRLPVTVGPKVTADTAHGVDADFDGDGLADLVYATSAGGSSSLVIHRGRRGTTPDPTGQRLPLAGSGYGCLVAVGDVDGDGYVDLAGVAAAGGAIMLHPGGPGGPGPARQVASVGVCGDNLAGGDFQGDGYADLVVGDNTVGAGSRGRAQLFAGSPTGLGAMPTWSADGPNVFLAMFGTGVGGSGDLDGDGIQDLGVSAQGAGGQNFGQGLFFRGPPVGATATLGTLSGRIANDRLGNALVLADLTGDGFADGIVTSVNYFSLKTAGAAYLVPGRAGGVGTPITLGEGTKSGSYGETAASAGDFDGDGLGDLLISEPGFLDGAVPVGRVALHHGAVTGAGPIESVTGDKASGERLLDTLGALGDVDGDGHPDIALVGTLAAGARLRLWRGGRPFDGASETIVTLPAGESVGAIAHAN
ncbi:MAG: VCBS repeat-containing protein [Myxococcales bacterium]|nr:VCBS repeat-containing protein [Myxococcales bacterium]